MYSFFVKFIQLFISFAEVVSEIEAVIPLAPLHNPAHITGIKAFQKALPNVFQIVVLLLVNLPYRKIP